MRILTLAQSDGNLLEPELVSPPLKKCHGSAAVGSDGSGDFVCSTQPLEAFGDGRKKQKQQPIKTKKNNNGFTRPKTPPNQQTHAEQNGKREAKDQLPQKQQDSPGDTAVPPPPAAASTNGSSNGDASGDSASQDRRDRLRILEHGAFSQPAKVNCDHLFRIDAHLERGGVW